MSSFTDPFDTRYDPEASRILGADHWRVLTPFKYFVGAKGSDEWVYVPAGYLTDGASVPKALQNIISPFGTHGQAAAVHDILCEYLSTTLRGRPSRINRKRANEIFLEAMTVLSVPRLRRCAAYQAVEAYRMLAKVETPSTTPLKRALEAAWPASANTVDLSLYNV